MPATKVRKRDAEGFRWLIEAKVEKFDLNQIRECQWALGLDREPIGAELLDYWSTRGGPRETVRVDGNLLTRQGRKRLMDRLAGTASNQALDATHARIGVGNSNTAAADTQTDLQASAGSSNRQFKLVDSAPSVGTGASSGVLTFVATFSTGVGNFAWEEWGIDGGTADGTTVTTEGNTTPGLINRKVTSLGTKTSAAAWVFTVTITIT